MLLVDILICLDNLFLKGFVREALIIAWLHCEQRPKQLITYILLLALVPVYTKLAGKSCYRTVKQSFTTEQIQNK